MQQIPGFLSARERERDGNYADKEKKRFLAYNLQAPYIHSNFYYYDYVYIFFFFLFRFLLPTAVVFRCTLWSGYKINALKEYLISVTIRLRWAADGSNCNRCPPADA